MRMHDSASSLCRPRPRAAMKHALAGLCACLGLLAAPTMAAPGRCGLPVDIGARELNDALALRSVEIIRRAADPKDAFQAGRLDGAASN